MIANAHEDAVPAEVISNENEIAIKNKEKQQYILSKIKNFQQAKRIAHQELITGLPAWDSEYDIIHSKHV